MVQTRMNYLLSAMGILAMLASCKQEPAHNEKKAVTVKTQIVFADELSGQQEYVGTVESENVLDVSFLVMGNVDRMYAVEGQKVAKGQKLSTMNKSSLQSAHELTVASLQQAEDGFKRLTAMYESGSLPEIKYIEIKTQLAQAKANEAIARKNLNDGTLYAPQSGIVSRRYVEPGASVMPGTPIFQIMDIGSVNVKVAIPENEISGVKTGTACRVKIAALNDESFEGIITEKGVYANPISHTYDIRVKIDNGPGRIMPGMVGKAYLALDPANRGRAIVVPLKAVQVDHTGKRFVWLKDKENKAQYREVTIGRLYGNGVAIEAGLNEGDELIIEGYQNISKGSDLIAQNQNK